jgi:hypothetical protein
LGEDEQYRALVLVSANRKNHFNYKNAKKASGDAELLQLHSLRLFSCGFASNMKELYLVRSTMMIAEKEFKRKQKAAKNYLYTKPENSLLDTSFSSATTCCSTSSSNPTG